MIEFHPKIFKFNFVYNGGWLLSLLLKIKQTNRRYCLQHASLNKINSLHLLRIYK